MPKENFNPQPANIKKSVNPLLIVAIILVLAVLFDNGYYLYKQYLFQVENHSLNQEMSAMRNYFAKISQKREIKSPEKLLAESDTEFKNWQTYANEIYGFQVQFPSDWPKVSFKEVSFNSNGAFPTDRNAYARLNLGTKAEKLGCYDAGQGYPYYFEVYPAADQEKIVSSLKINKLTAVFKEKEVNGSKVIWYTEGNKANECSNRKAMIVGKDKIVIFKTTQPLSQDIGGVFEQIISTFKFTNL
jgi:hypothetical protein